MTGILAYLDVYLDINIGSLAFIWLMLYGIYILSSF